LIAGEPDGPIADELGGIADRANIKGFAFEYMTSGRAIVLGDIGPWACAGCDRWPRLHASEQKWGLDREARTPDGQGCEGGAARVDRQGIADVRSSSGQRSSSTVPSSRRRRPDPRDCGGTDRALPHVEPEREQTDPSVSTE
jgi:glutamate synthase (NADPH/NADH) large chain